MVTIDIGRLLPGAIANRAKQKIDVAKVILEEVSVEGKSLSKEGGKVKAPSRLSQM